MPDEQLRLADLLAALSVTTDLAMGQAPEKAIRACVVAMEIARHMDLPQNDLSDVFYTTLLKHLGCTASSHEEVRLFGPDDLGVRPIAERTDVASTSEVLTLLARAGRGTGTDRLRHVARAMADKEASATIMRSVCEVAARMAERLELGSAVARALYETLERWDGRGEPRRLRGENIALPARIAEPATQAVVFHRMGGSDAAREMVRRRAGGWFDPAVAEAFEAVGPNALDRLDKDDPWAVVLDVEPEPVRRVGPDTLDTVAETFADMVDLKTPFTLGHSTRVADLASVAADALRVPDAVAVRRAALLHDLGKTAVGTGILEKPAPLSIIEWEQVRLHPYHTERILTRSVVLEPIARIAGMHHERQDGSGYHHGASGGGVPIQARLIAAADVYDALTNDRPHRDAHPAAQAADVLTREATSGRLDAECVKTVLDVAGQSTAPRVRPAWPAGLSDREVEVARLVARGLSNRAIAQTLFISPRTAEHHVQHVYGKLGSSTRAAVALFCMEHGLLS